MDADDSNLIPTPTETSFIILGSQGESQRLSDTEQHAEILRSLPALQMPKKSSRNRSPRLMQQSEGRSSDTSTKEKTSSADLVSNTASEEKQQENQQKTVSETELQDDDSASITVDNSSTIKTSGPSHGQDLLEEDDSNNNQSCLGQGKEEQTSLIRSGSGSSKESSLSSRTKDTLGSYDQCELYKTQEEHIHGQRFSLFAPSLSEQDMFEDESDNDDEGRQIATPAQHIGSLQLSAEPMLVPESFDEAEYEIPPSPDIYDATHLIIPNSPTEGDSDGPETGDEEIADQTLCNLAACNTMAEDDDQVSRKASSVADDVQIGSNEESVHLHLSSSHTVRNATEASLSKIKGSQEDKSLKSYQIRGQTMADEVIVIKSQTAEEDSQFFALRLSPSQGEVTQASTALERKQCLPEAETVGFMPREGTLLHPSSVVSLYAGQSTKGGSQRQRSLVEEQIQTSKHKLSDSSSSVVQVAPLLTIGMIDTQSEKSPSQPRFHLEKPGAGDMEVETSEECQKNVFQRARKSRKQPLIQDDSEDYVNLRPEVVCEGTEQELVAKELCKESQGESNTKSQISSDIREAMQLDTEPYDPNETLEPGTSSDQTMLREAAQCGHQIVLQPLNTCTGQSIVAGLCPPLSVSVSLSRQGSSMVGDKLILADSSRHNERKDEDVMKESLSGKMSHSVQENPDADKNVVQIIEDVSVTKPAVDVAGNTYHPMKVSLVEGQTPHVSCTAENTTLIQTQRQESLGLASSSRLSTNKTLIASSSGLHNKNSNTSRREASAWKGKLVHKGHHLRRRENQMCSRSFELNTRGNGFSEEQLHPSKKRKIDPYTFCGSESWATPGREEIVQNPVQLTRQHSSPTTVTPERTPILSRKRRRLIHKKTGLLKSSSSGDSETSRIKPKAHVHFQTDHTWAPDPSLWLAPYPSDTARGSHPQYGQHSVTDAVVTPSAAPSTQPIVPSTLPQLEKRLSLEKQSTSLSLKGSQEEKYERWTVVTQTVMQFTIVKVEEKVIHQGKILSNKVISLEEEEPRAVKVTSQSEVQFTFSPNPSPSRSVSTLTSGDLGDISSSSHGSQSRSVSSDSSKASLIPSSQDRSSFGSQEQSDPHHFVSPQAVVRTRTSITQIQTSAESKEKEDQHAEPVTPNKPDTEVGAVVDNPHSDVEHSASGTPHEVSTINKTGSCNHTRTFSGECSKASDSLFSPSEKSDSTADKSSLSSTGKGEVTKPQPKPSTTSAAVGSTSAVKAASKLRSRKSEIDEISPEIPYQDKVISSPISDIESPTTASRTIKSSDQPGSNVFAKWKDGFFYPGKIVSTDRYNRYKVAFLDGDSQTVKSSNLLLVEQLPVGQSVLVKSSEDQLYECGLIVQRSPSHYIVKKDDGSNGRYSLDAVILSEDHAGYLLMNEGDEARQICPVVGPPVLATNLADISLDNLVDGKRRTSKSEIHQADTESKLGGNESATKRGKKRKLGDIEPQATSTPTPKGKAMSATKDRGSPEFSPLMTSRESPLTSRRQSPKKAKIGLFGDLKGPLPAKKTLFKGLVFMLTHVEKTIDQKEQEKKLLEDSSLEASTDSSTGEEEVQIPFDKDHLKGQIERGGGTVLDKFDPDLVCGSNHCYLLSSTYQKTIKYLQCLAAGVPCVSHLWIIDSCKQGLLLDYGPYILPAGISLEKKRIMECSKTGAQPLMNLRVSVVSKTDKFAEEWIKILQLAKCVIIDKFPPPVRSDESSRPEVVVTDSSISPAHIKRAKQLNIPLVSSQWVIQSLVNSQQVKFDGHSQYSYNYSNV